MLLRTLVGLMTIAGAVAGQQPSRPANAVVTGTFGLGTHRLPSPKRDGCWLESAPVASNSAHVQIRCMMPAPSHHVGIVDEQLPLRNNAVQLETTKHGGRCRIGVRFANGAAVVTQDGNASACGFGANVNVAGTYRRISGRRPHFDLAPIERP